MTAFCAAHPALAQIVIARDAQALVFSGQECYTLYDQGMYEVIEARALAPAPGVIKG